MTKRNKQILNSYLNRGSRDFKRFYKMENEAVRGAYRACVHAMLEENGDDFKVISCNSHRLSAGYIVHRETDSLVYVICNLDNLTFTRREIYSI